MKAYIANEAHNLFEGSIVVFAESAGKARAVALQSDAFEDYEFTEIRVKRCPQLDKCYRGLPEMDWYNMDDRIAMVRYADYCCDYGEDCEECPAKEWCSEYEVEHEEDK